MRNSIGYVIGVLFVAGCSASGGGNVPGGGGTGAPSGDPMSSGTPSDPGQPGAAPGTMPGKPAPAMTTHLMSGLAIDQIAIFQGVKVPLVSAGARAPRAVPVVANRDGLVRVYAKPAAAWSSKSVTAVLRLTAADGTVFPLLQSTATIATASTDAAAASTFNFDVPGSSLPVGVKMAVALTDPSAPETKTGTASTARYPADGSSEALGTASSGAELKIMLVPVQYRADGSNRLPNISAAQVESYRQEMFAIYPTAKVTITTRAPFPWSQPINPDGSGFGQILQAMVDLRQRDGAADDVYYFGAFAPDVSFDSFCSGGSCVTGLSGVVDQPTDATGRASVGTGFGDAGSTVTMAHEVGHAHGRSHAPCGGASGVDPSFPYSNGGIGVWGYNIVTKQLVNPSVGRDLMGYCQPEWVSDYTYSALFDRVAFVNHAKEVRGVRAFDTPVPYRFVNVAGDGSLSFGEPVALRAQPAAEAHAVEYFAPDGSTVMTGTGHFYKYDHLPGGFLIVPEGPASYSALAVHGLNARAATRVARSY